jgi:hypothetical protein
MNDFQSSTIVSNIASGSRPNSFVGFLQSSGKTNDTNRFNALREAMQKERLSHSPLEKINPILHSGGLVPLAEEGLAATMLLQTLGAATDADVTIARDKYIAAMNTALRTQKLLSNDRTESTAKYVAICVDTAARAILERQREPSTSEQML